MKKLACFVLCFLFVCPLVSAGVFAVTQVLRVDLTVKADRVPAVWGGPQTLYMFDAPKVTSSGTGYTDNPYYILNYNENGFSYGAKWVDITNLSGSVNARTASAFSGTFYSGHTYRLYVVVCANEYMDKEFANSISQNCYINGIKAGAAHFWTGNVEYQEYRRFIVAYRDFPVSATTVDTLNLSVYAPSHDHNPLATLKSDCPYATAEEFYWQEDGKPVGSPWASGTPSVFKAGHSYKAVLELKAKTGYEFAVNMNVTPSRSAVNATVNGYPATVEKIYDEDPYQMIRVTYDFGVCPQPGETVLWGDTDGSGVLDISDVTLLAKVVAGWTTQVSAYRPANADVDRSGTVDLADIMLIAKKIAGWQVTLGVKQ